MNNMKRTQYSLKINMILNAIKGIMSIIFPLITFPYISKVLGIDNIGKYNFSNSVISYFVLLAELGISTYAIREGARIREKPQIVAFASEMFSINMISTLISYIMMGVFLLCVPKFHDYIMIILVLSISIFFRTIGTEWIYSIYEDYIYITIRSIIVQIVSLFLLFIFVRTAEGLLCYSFISVFSGIVTGIMNCVYARKYCNISFTWNIDWKKHLKPILILFGMSATVTIYVSSDTTILGFICSDAVIGQYSVSVKVYTIVKTLLSSILVVSIPRISAILGEGNNEKFKSILEDIYKMLLTFMLPAIAGLIVLRKQIILFISSEEFLGAVSSLILLAIALFFCMGAWFWGQCVLIPLKEEKKVFKITVLSAVINIILNIILIPIWQENAAALTTIIAEAISYFYCMYCGRKNIGKIDLFRIVMKVMIGTVSVIVTCRHILMMVQNELISLLCCIFCSILFYLFIEIILKNEVIYDTAKNIIKKCR